jgi:hypothetical protein
MRFALALAVPAVLVLAGCDPDTVSFQAVNVLASTGPEGLSLNDEIAVRFSERLDPGSVSVESLRVTDGSGRRISIKARAASDLLFISPTDPDGWPPDTQLAVEVPHPWLGRPIRSASGAPNDAPFRQTVSTGRRYASRGGTLKLVYHSLPISGGTDVTEEAEFLFELDGAIDRASLDHGIALHDLTHDEAAHVAAQVVSPRRISVLPFAGRAFRSGTRYRLTLTQALRAEDTRKLGEPVSFVFTTTRSKSGEHTTDFRPENLVDPSLKPDKGPLTPLLTTEPLLIGVGVSHEQSKPFGRDPSKVQILIPKDAFKGIPESVIISAMSFRVFGAEPTSLRLSARLDYAAPAHEEALGAEFEENWSLPGTRQRDLIGAEGDLHVLDPSEGVVTFVFPRPFFYERIINGEARSLVLEIVNESGIINDSAGIVIRGETQGASSRFAFVESNGDAFGEGTAHRFVPALSFSIQRARPVVVKPWNTTAVLDPEYFRRQDQIVATPGFVNFLVDYRGLDGVPAPADNEGWTDLSALDGHRTIQARIRFILRSADPIPKDAGLLRLTVPFRERGE